LTNILEGHIVTVEVFGVIATNLPLTVPLTFASLLIAILIPRAAKRGRLHIPGYVGIASFAVAFGLLAGRFAGMRGIAGSILGISLSIAFFLLMSVAGGSFLALFFYEFSDR
jgi:hypothetical protein